ncbi:MAG: response regulator transcription factor [Saprospiraceae bacterium]|nr:response regulator transcription factor [Saprospiraceae bacterium]
MAKKILIIEDSKIMRKFLSHLFKNTFDVVSLENGKDAIEWLKKGIVPQLVIADLQMPIMDGLEFTKYFRSTISSTIPLIILSGEKNSDNKIACLQSGANDYILKPFRPQILDLKIKSLLAVSQVP